jgi:hypothetical protein
MKKTLIFIFILGTSMSGFAQVNAVTENGEQVVLYKDGTWKSLETKSGWDTRMDTLKFTKSSTSTFLIKGSRVEYGVWINPKKWQFKKDQKTDVPIEYKFTLTGQDAYAMIISERIQVPLNSLKEVALKNALKAAPDAKIVQEEIRNINGLNVLLLQMEGTISGINFVYYGYYYSDEGGTVQFLSYTSKNLFPTYKPEMEQLLNGFVKL